MMIEKPVGLTQNVWKYEIPELHGINGDEFYLTMPLNAQILTVQMQYGKPCIWALVDPKARMQERRFRIAGTGHPLDYDLMRYVGTFQLREGAIIIHLFEV